MKMYPEEENEMLYMVEEKDEDAVTCLINKYSNLISIIMAKYKSFLRELSLEEKDLYQEGLLGLLEAINSYDKSKNVLFKTYATKCIDNRMKTILRYNQTNKNILHNTAISLDSYNENSSDLHQYLGENKLSPEEKLILKEQLEEINKQIKKLLTPNEYKIYLLKLKGYKNEELAKLTNKNKKTIENLTTRINKKLKVIKKDN